MNVKIDTKEKFIVFTPLETELTANMTDVLVQMLRGHLQKGIPHIVFNMSAINKMDNDSCSLLSTVQQEFYEKNCSFVICALQKEVETKLDSLEILEILNVTPTESEAWDIVQMEELERELLSDED
ncbi:MAG: STAS domain-containing protein [Ferruginibacter sp.]